MGSGDTPLAAAVRAALDAAWEGRYCVPNPDVYPWQFLWDSCFHALVWAELGDERAAVELASVFRNQSPAGFVPHMAYDRDPHRHASFWGRPGASSITQPPMYGHACAELARRGVDVPDEVVDRSVAGLRFLLDRRARLDGLVAACHPWESGADDVPRWDDWCPGGYDRGRWYHRKGEILGTVERSPGGDPVANPGFAVAPASLNALVAFNAVELGRLTGDAALLADADALVDALDAQYDEERRTWRDAGPRAAGSGRVRTLDGLFPALVSRRRDAVADALADAVDGTAFGGRCGPAGVHRDEPAFDPRSYWRGPAWPPLTYLLRVAAARAGDAVAGTRLAATATAAAAASRLGESCDPDDGTTVGAAPQCWAGLALVTPAPPPAGPQSRW